MAELSSYHRDYVAYKVENIHYLAPDRKSWLIPRLDQCSN